MRRDKNDQEWQALKLRVFQRDGGCQLMKILSPQKAMTLMREAKGMVQILDPAHVFGVGPFPHLCYVDDNVVLLNRYSHDMLDSMHDPVTGKFIDRETRDRWWTLIVGEERFRKLEALSQTAGESNE